jgi:hypothetical protein
VARQIEIISDNVRRFLPSVEVLREAIRPSIVQEFEAINAVHTGIAIERAIGL